MTIDDRRSDDGRDHRLDLARRRRRASVAMAALVAMCVAVAALPASTRLVTEGWAAFVARPAGVGGSPDSAEEPETALSEPQTEPESAPATDAEAPGDPSTTTTTSTTTTSTTLPTQTTTTTTIAPPLPMQAVAAAMDAVARHRRRFPDRRR